MTQHRRHDVHFCHVSDATAGELAAPNRANRWARVWHGKCLRKAAKARYFLLAPPSSSGLAVKSMNLYPPPDFPPPDFVAFLAQRRGLSEEAAEHRLEHWLDEYHASGHDCRTTGRSASALLSA